MCGFAAVRRFKAPPVDPADLARMCSTIAHRGPDDAGYALLDGGCLGLGHVRLSILDLQTGDQPLYTADGSVGIVFNGEVYDHVALRARLQAEGFAFHTTSDTEVIAVLYQRYGMDFLAHLNGEFAFLLWDAKQRRLIAVKDRVGIKPLFYRVTPEEALFCSEAKGILALDRVPRKIDPAYLTGPFLAANPRAFSLFGGIAALSPGHYLVVDDRGVHPEQRYWRQSFPTRREMTFEEAKAGIRQRMSDAVKRRMVADVPVCTYLSGGIDSTVVCALMREQGVTVKAFNVGFTGSVYDESVRARRIAEALGVEFESLHCPMEALAEHLPRTLFHTETVFFNPSALGKLMLSGEVRRQGYKVTITGEGADEVFAGYPYFKLEKLWRLSQGSPEEAARSRALFARFRKLEQRSEGLMWNRKNNWRAVEPLFGYPSFLHVRSQEYGALIPRLFEVEKLGLGPGDTPAATFQRSFDAEELRKLDPIQATLLITLHQLSGVVIPTLGDRVEMANSVEGRTPFLDVNLLEFAGTMPPEFLLDIDQLREKYVLYEAFTDLVPEFVRREHKHPFFSPNWSVFSRTPAGAALMAEHLSSSALRATGIFRPGFLRIAKLLWRLAPRASALHSRLDVLVGAVLAMQILHSLFVAARPPSRADFPMVNRSPA